MAFGKSHMELGFIERYQQVERALRNATQSNRPATGTFESGGRKCDIRWSTWFADDTPRDLRNQPVYCVV